MNISSKLPRPLNTFAVDVPANQYYDFELPPNSKYPLKGVTYSVDYGHISGFTTEDGYELDLFVGNSLNGLCGVILIDRGSVAPSEHKFYVALADIEIDMILKQLAPVVISHEKMDSVATLIQHIANYKDKS